MGTNNALIEDLQGIREILRVDGYHHLPDILDCAIAVIRERDQLYEQCMILMNLLDDEEDTRSTKERILDGDA
jgi:hypothetical protein